ncbi:hypothetical protein BOTBODRAFT_174788 [Botryobasidium botryosum FD-172 SS1]|uniref:U2A'/phosphoprotein 32 family A C-terminal domain-containing protein n=1 Tax=Botryobasidium botryosum (strain FD-172 SS1) TaxID=930990 RepID=A0A067MFF1_BOTB1|nr:hypothetical protein BOTBODRAFT_174788 [Botryobasidium botryosum FD-172 SS1]
MASAAAASALNPVAEGSAVPNGDAVGGKGGAKQDNRATGGEKNDIVRDGDGGNEGDRGEEPKKEARTARVVLHKEEPEESDEEDDEDRKDEESGIHEVEDEDLLVDFPDETEEIELIHSRITSLTPLRLPRFAGSLKKLCLRQNFLAALDPADFQPLTRLEELDFYDNQLKNLGDALVGLDKLAVLDLSFNLLRAVPDTISSLTSLATIYFVQNKITKIDDLHPFGATLKSLELGGNRIRKIENLDALVNLEELWLGKNKITKLENLSTLGRLRILSIQSNRITKLEGLENLVNLEDFYISHNGVERLEGLENNLKLQTLDVGHNSIPAIENISHLTRLEELWINNNVIPNVHDLTPQLGHIATLKTIYLEGNPCQREDMSGYRRKIILALPQVQQIDAKYVIHSYISSPSPLLYCAYCIIDISSSRLNCKPS